MAGGPRYLEEDCVRESSAQAHRTLRFYVHDVSRVLYRIVFRRLRSEPLSLGKDSVVGPIARRISKEIRQRAGNHGNQDAGGDRRAQCAESIACSHTESVSYTHLRAHETPEHLVCRLLLEK